MSETPSAQVSGSLAATLEDVSLTATGAVGGSLRETIRGGSAQGTFPIETTWPDREVRHNISDAELEMIHKGQAEDRIADKMFDVFLAACGAIAGAAPQVAKDFWGAFFSATAAPYDVFGVVALLIFGGGVAAIVVSRLFWKKKVALSAVDVKVAEIRERTNRTKHVVGSA